MVVQNAERNPMVEVDRSVRVRRLCLDPPFGSPAVMIRIVVGARQGLASDCLPNI